MQITKSIAALWSPQRTDAPAEAARSRPAEEGPRAEPPPVVAQIYVLDTDRDGWIDADDLPYDELLLLERARAAEAAEAARRQHTAQTPEDATPAPAVAAETPVPRPEPSPPTAAHVDLLA